MFQQKRRSMRVIFMIGILMQAVLLIYGGKTILASSSKKHKNTLILHKMDGSRYKKIVTSKSSVKLPSMTKKSGYTFLGWSKKKGTHKDPQYEVGEYVKVSGTVHLYPVYYKRSTEPDRDVSGLSSGYDHVIFVGDSRIRSMKQALESEYGENGIENVSFVAKGGTGLSWLKSSGIKLLWKQIQTVQSENENARIAIIFNHGVNDLQHKSGKSVNVSKLAEKYSSYMKQIGTELKAAGCDLYYMSVNPVNSAHSSTQKGRKSPELRAFNKLLKNKLKGQYTFIDCYSWLMRNGYSTRRIDGSGIDDGVHYTIKTSKRIYAYCMVCLRRYIG